MIPYSDADKYADRLDNAREAREPLATDTCFACGKSRATLAAGQPKGTKVLVEVPRTIRPTDRPPAPGPLAHVCTACVKLWAQFTGMIARETTPRFAFEVRCTADNRPCPFGEHIAFRLDPLTKPALVRALRELGWAVSPKAILFTCPRCVARGA